MKLATLTPADAAAYQALRLRALRDHPEAFGAAYEDELTMPVERVAERLVSSPERFTLGVWEGDALVGMAGFYRNAGRKTAHRGGVWGMYVAPEARGRRLGFALLSEIIKWAKQLEGLEEITLAVTVGNLAAKTIYAKAGFETAYIEKRYLKIDEQYYDLEWMMLRF